MKRRLVLIGVVAALAGCSESTPEIDSTPTREPETKTTPTETPTEIRTTRPNPAEFRLVKYNIPKEAEINENITIGLTIENTGGQTGSYSEPLYLKTPDSDWAEIQEVDFGEVKPGEKSTLSSSEPFSFDYMSRYEFRLGDFDETAVLQVVSAKLGWGEVYTTPENYKIRADKPTLQSTYTYENYRGEEEEEEPDSGGQWAFMNFWAKNETGEPNYSPLSSEIKLLTGSSQFDNKGNYSREPVDKGQQYDGGELQPGVVREGWIAYEVPDEIAPGDLTAAWSQSYYDGEIAVNWSGSN